MIKKIDNRSRRFDMDTKALTLLVEILDAGNLSDCLLYTSDAADE